MINSGIKTSRPCRNCRVFLGAMMINSGIKTLVRNSIRYKKARNIFVIIAIVLTTMLITSVFSIGNSYSATGELQSIRTSGSAAQLSLSNPTEDQLQMFENQELNIVKDFGRLVPVGNLVLPETVDANLGIVCLNDVEWNNHRKPTVSNVVGNYPQKADEIMIATWALKEIGIEDPQVGMTISLSYFVNAGTGDIETKDFVLSGYYTEYTHIASGNRDNVLVSEEFCINNGISLSNGIVMISTVNAQLSSDEIARLTEDLSVTENQTLTVIPAYNIEGTAVTIAIIVCVLCIMTCGYLLVNNIIHISVANDVRFFGLLRAVGTTKKQIRVFVLREVIVLSLIGIPIGLLLGAAASSTLVKYVMKIAFADTSAYGFRVIISPVIFIGGGIFAWLTAIISALIPARLAGNISPVTAIKYIGEQGKKKRRKSRKGATPGRMALRNVFRNKKSTCLVFLSLLLGMSLFMVSSGVLSSVSGENAAKSQGEADFVLYTSLQNAGQTINTEQKNSISKINGISNLRSTQVPVNAKEQIVEPALVTYDADIFDKYLDEMFSRSGMSQKDREYLQSSEGTAEYTSNFTGYIFGLDTQYVVDLNKTLKSPINLEAFESGDIVILREPVDGSVDTFEEGTVIEVKNSAENKTFNYTIATGSIPAKFHSGYSLNAPTMYISKDALEKFSTTTEIYRIAFDTDGSNDKQILAQLKLLTASNSNIVIESRYEKAIQYEQNLTVFKTLLYSVSIIFLSVGILNYMNTMFVSISVRKREFAMLESIGMSKKQLLGMLLTEGFIYAFISSILILVGGSGLLYWIYKFMMSDKDFAQFAEFHYPIVLIAGILLAVLAICLIVPAIAYKRMSRSSVVLRLRTSS